MALLPDKFPGEQLAIKIVDSVSTGIGSAVGPWLARRRRVKDARTEMDVMRVKLFGAVRIRQELKEIASGRKGVDEKFKLIDLYSSEDEQSDAEISAAKKEFLEHLQRAGINPENFIEVDRQTNLLQIGVEAIEQAANDPKQAASAAPVNDDWLAQWRNRAQEISNEQMQQLWAKVLKEETKSPGRFSIHTMDLLSRMSHTDAELIAKIGNYILNRGFLPSNELGFLATIGVNLDDLLYLQDLGILNSVGSELGGVSITLALSPYKDTKVTFLRLEKTAILLEPKDQKQDIQYPAFPLTRMGKEILSLAAITEDADYIEHLINVHKPTCRGILRGDVTDFDPPQFQVNNIRSVWKEPETK